MSAAFETSPLHYEKEAINARRRLSSNLDELADNLTAGRMLDEVLGYARGGGASFLKGLGNAASENPIPTLLVGVGAAMFLSGKGRVGHRNGADWHGKGAERATHQAPSGVGVGNGAAAFGEAASHAGSGAVRNAQSAGAAIAEATGHLRDTAASAASGAAGYARDGAEAVGDMAADAAGKVREAADAVGSSVADTASAVGNYAKAASETLTTQAGNIAEETANLAHDLSARIARAAKEQPLMVAAAGLAIGAAIAALLPRTDFEDSLMGETSEAVKESVSEAASDAYEKTKEAASHVVEEITDTAKEEGLTAGAAASAARDFGDKAARVVQAGKQATEEEVGRLGYASPTSRKDQA